MMIWIFFMNMATAIILIAKIYRKIRNINIEINSDIVCDMTRCGWCDEIPPIPPKRDKPEVLLSASVSPPDDSQLLTASAAFTLLQRERDIERIKQRERERIKQRERERIKQRKRERWEIMIKCGGKKGANRIK